MKATTTSRRKALLHEVRNEDLLPTRCRGMGKETKKMLERISRMGNVSQVKSAKINNLVGKTCQGSPSKL